MSFYIFGLVTYGSRFTSTSVFASVSMIKCVIILCYYHIYIYIYFLYKEDLLTYNNDTYNRVTSICIDLS